MASILLQMSFANILNTLKPNFNLTCIHIIDEFDQDSIMTSLVLLLGNWNVLQGFGAQDQNWKDHPSCAVLCLTSRFEFFVEAFEASAHNPRLWWLLLEDITIPRAYWNDLELRLDSKTFLITRNTLSVDFVVKDVYRIDQKQEVIEDICGSILTCDFFGTLWTRRSNLLGLELQVYYQEWAPMCFVNKDTKELEGGIMFDLMETLAMELNVSVK